MKVVTDELCRQSGASTYPGLWVGYGYSDDTINVDGEIDVRKLVRAIMSMKHD
jgi:ribosomal protein L27